MSERFAGLKKLRDKTAGELISGSRIPFKTKIESPRESDIATVLAEFDQKGAVVDMLALLSMALPPREAVWWACLAARDLYPDGGPARSPCLEAAEAWVRKPAEDTQTAVRQALEKARPQDEGQGCATAAMFADGRLGPAELAQFDAPPDAFAMNVFATVVKSYTLDPPEVEAKGRLLIDRALDIARGGNGRVEPAPAAG